MRQLRIEFDDDPKPRQRPSAKKAPPENGFRRETTQRLRELLDRCQYEVWKFGGETVTSEEAIRDMIFIEAELRRRAEEWLDTLLKRYG